MKIANKLTNISLFVPTLMTAISPVFLYLSLGLFLPNSAFASEAHGRVEKLEQISDGRFVVFVKGAANRPNKPACLHPVGYFIIADENSDEGKMQIKMLKYAKKNKVSVDIVGTGTCKRFVDAEDISYMGITE